MDNVSRARAQNAFREGNYAESSRLYDILLASDPQDLGLLVEKANCMVFLSQWTECFQNFAKAAKNKGWKSLYLNELTSNLLKTLTMTGKKKAPNETQSATQNIQQNLLCAICHQLLQDPTTILCGHTFCRQCVFKQGNRECFYCVNMSCESDKFPTNFILKNILQTCFKNKVQAVQFRRKGNEFFCKQDYNNALRNYTEALDLDPNNHLILSNLSYVRSTLGDYQSALDYAEKACAFMPYWDKAFYHKACALVGLKNYSQAAIAYLQVLLINPRNDVAHKSLIKVLREILTSSNSEENDALLSNQQPSPVIHDLASSLDKLFQEQTCKTEMDDISRGTDLMISNFSGNESILSENLRITDLECSLCCRMFYQPVTCPCGHTFCQWCLNRCLDHNPVCPICRYPMEKYIGDAKQNVTVMIEILCRKYFTKEFEERKAFHEEEIKRLASVALDTSENIPVFVCTLAIPTVPCPLHIFEPRYRLMIRECMESGSRQFGMCIPSADYTSFLDYGVMLEIQDFSLLSDGRSLIQCVGGRRFKVLSRGMKDGYHTAQVEWLKDRHVSEDEMADVIHYQLVVYEKVKKWLSSLPWFVKLRLLQLAGEPPDCDHSNTNDRNGPGWIWWCVNLLPMETDLKLEIIAATDVRQRLDKVKDFIEESREA